MTEGARLEQLRALLVRLERTPPSAARDWMLGEVRARAVDVETGEPPAAMRALPGDGAQPEISASPVRSHSEAAEAVEAQRKRTLASRRPAPRAAWGASPARLATSAPDAAACPALRTHARESVVDLLEHGGVLCLDDQPAALDGPSRPWSGGLRG